MLTHVSQKSVPECPQSYNNNISCSPCAREPVVTSAISALLSRMMWGGSLKGGGASLGGGVSLGGGARWMTETPALGPGSSGARGRSSGSSEAWQSGIT